MNTVQILGLLTALEIIFCGLNGQFSGVTIWLWIGYGLYKMDKNDS